MKYQGKTAIPLIVSIGENPRRTLSISMFLVMMSRVTKDSDLKKVFHPYMMMMIYPIY